MLAFFERKKSMKLLQAHTSTVHIVFNGCFVFRMQDVCMYVCVCLCLNACRQRKTIIPLIPRTTTKSNAVREINKHTNIYSTYYGNGDNP